MSVHCRLRQVRDLRYASLRVSMPFRVSLHVYSLCDRLAQRPHAAPGRFCISACMYRERAVFYAGSGENYPSVGRELPGSPRGSLGDYHSLGSPRGSFFAVWPRTFDPSVVTNFALASCCLLLFCKLINLMVLHDVARRAAISLGLTECAFLLPC